MFWQTKQVSSHQLEALLNKKDVTIYELMDDENILQECKSQNKKLLEYLTTPNVMEELVTLITQDPSTELAERQRYKYPNIACELLTCDVPVINEKLSGDEALLLKLYSFIDTEQPLNPLLASYFSKTIGVLIGRATYQVLAFLKSRQRCIDLLLHHLETSAIMDLLLNLVTKIEGSEMRQNILTWLNSQQLVQRLVKLLSPDMEPSRHSNAAILLSDIIVAARENQKNSIEKAEPDPILSSLESEETVTLLLETILTEKKMESSIVGGIQVLLTLLKPRMDSVPNEGSASSSKSVEEITETKQRIKISNATIPFLEALHDLLFNPPPTSPVKTTSGILDSPVGNTRLHVLKLFAALIATENPKIRQKLAELDVFQTILDLFFKYSWNNFLHTQVQRCIELAITCNFLEDNANFYDYLFIKCRLIDRILEVYTANDTRNGGVRPGYMGHLINISNIIMDLYNRHDGFDEDCDLFEFLKKHLSLETLEKWEKFMNNDLALVNMAQGRLRRTLTSNYIEDYSGREVIFNDDENNVFPLDSVLSDSEQEMRRNFESMVESLMSFPSKSDEAIMRSIFPIKGQFGESSFQTVTDDENLWSYRTKQKESPPRSPDEEDDGNEEDKDEKMQTKSNMDIDETNSWDSWTTASSILQTVNPWENDSTTTTQLTEGWANFDSFDKTFGTNWKNEESSSENAWKSEQFSEQTANWANFTNFQVALVTAENEKSILETGNGDSAKVEKNNIASGSMHIASGSMASDDDNANPIVFTEDANPEDKGSVENVKTPDAINSTAEPQ